MNILFCSAGRRVELIKDFRKAMKGGRIVVTDISITAPSIYVADKFYDAGLITDHDYVKNLINICKIEEINVITTLIDPEIEILAKNRDKFEEIGVVVLAPYEKTAELCYDKAKLISFLSNKGIRTVKTWSSIGNFIKALNKDKICFPVFVKPRTGSGSVGARRVDNIECLEKDIAEDGSLIIQEYMGDAVDLDADVYVDTISNKAVSIFSKKKLEMKIGGASKTVSFKDEKLNLFIRRIIDCMQFSGPIDIDFFLRNGEYYLSEINPRFGGAYIHAFESGVNFIKLIENNVAGIENNPICENYDDGIIMMMYDSIITKRIDGLV